MPCRKEDFPGRVKRPGVHKVKRCTTLNDCKQAHIARREAARLKCRDGAENSRKLPHDSGVIASGRQGKQE